MLIGPRKEQLLISKIKVNAVHAGPSQLPDHYKVLVK